MMVKNSRTTSLLDREIYENSAPADNTWGQPPASCFVFQTHGTALIGYQICIPYLERGSFYASQYSEEIDLLNDEFEAWEAASDQDFLTLGL